MCFGAGSIFFGNPMAGGFRSNRSFARSTVSSSLGNDFPCLFPPPFAPLRRFFRLRGPVAPFFDALEFEEAESFLDSYLNSLFLPNERRFMNPWEATHAVSWRTCRIRGLAEVVESTTAIPPQSSSASGASTTFYKLHSSERTNSPR